MKKPRILVFASGDKEGGGSGFQELVEFSRTNPPVLDADIVAVVSNHLQGGVYKKALNLKIPFQLYGPPCTMGDYQSFVKFFAADYVMLSGWLKLVQGLDPRKTVNIHPGPLPEFGGPGKYGHFVHEAVIEAYRAGKIKQSAVTMHFVIDKGPDKQAYDKGPIIFQYPVLIRPDDTPETLAKRVNGKERAWQAYVLNHVVHGHIWLSRTDNGFFRVVHSHTGLNSFCPDRLWEIPQLAERK